MDISVVVPVYNEEESVLETIDRIKKVMNKSSYKYEIIAVDDGSEDRSGEILEKIKGIIVIHNTHNIGYGASLKKGIKQAKGYWILITDADGSYPIEDIPKLLKYIDKYDMVVGARIGKHIKTPVLRKPARWILKKIAELITKAKIPDLNSGLRIFKKEIVEKFWTILPNKFSFTSTITIAFLINDYFIKYIPINYYARKGKSTISPIKDFFGFIILIFRSVMYFEPLKFFFWPGVLIFLLGIIIAIYQLIVLNNLGDISVFLALIGVQICFLGLIADLIVKRK